MKSLVLVFAIAVVMGCDIPKSSSGSSSKKVSYSNKLRVSNRSGVGVSKVVVDWNGKSFTITNEDQALEEGSTAVRKLPVRESVETTFKATVYYSSDEKEPVVHEQTISLNPQESKTVDILFNTEKKISIRKR